MTATTTQPATIITQAPGRQWLMPSASQPGTVHVIRRVGAVISCDCNGYVYRGRCRHQSAVVNHLAAADARISALVAERNPLLSKRISA